ncbi:MAG: acylphosphatase [Acidobacteria bacterium]|nr:MAG: acylphosphatase [Acidobacteriota bacterium]
MIARRAIVSGRVQGVGFRFFAERAARRAGVRGWVRNLEDGRVETVVEGDEAAVARYLDEIRKGPLGGRVTDLRVEERQPERFESFQITT